MSLKQTESYELDEIIIKVPVLSKETTIKTFIQTMEKHGLDFFPVTDHGMLIGVVTEKDMIKFIRTQPISGMQAVVIQNIPKDVMKSSVSEIMTRHPIAINYKERKIEAMKRMTASNLKRMVVVDDQKKVMGIIRIRDLFKQL